jgi:hypothetical protein
MNKVLLGRVLITDKAHYLKLGRNMDEFDQDLTLLNLKIKSSLHKLLGTTGMSGIWNAPSVCELVQTCVATELMGLPFSALLLRVFHFLHYCCIQWCLLLVASILFDAAHIRFDGSFLLIFSFLSYFTISVLTDMRPC